MSALPGGGAPAPTRRDAEVLPKPLDAVEMVRRIREALAAGDHRHSK
jgi:hypothetical protein